MYEKNQIFEKCKCFCQSDSFVKIPLLKRMKDFPISYTAKSGKLSKQTNLKNKNLATLNELPLI